MEEGLALVGGAVSGFLDLGSIRRKTEQVMRKKPVSSLPPWSVYQTQLLDLGFTNSLVSKLNCGNIFTLVYN